MIRGKKNKKQLLSEAKCYKDILIKDVSLNAIVNHKILNEIRIFPSEN